MPTDENAEPTPPRSEAAAIPVSDSSAHDAAVRDPAERKVEPLAVDSPELAPGPEAKQELGLEPEPASPTPSVATPRSSASSTASTKSTASAADTETKPLRPLVRGSHYEWVLAVAGCTVAVLIAAAMFGQRGLFPMVNEDGTPFISSVADRLLLSFKILLRIAVGGGCLIAGAYFLQFIDRRPVGDVRVLGSRMLAIVALAMLPVLLPIELTWLKRFYDVIVPVAVAWGLLMLFFRIKPRDAGVVLLGALVAVTVLSLGSLIVRLAVY